MSETPPNPNGAMPNDPATAPSMRVLAQYVKDLSFENPKAPASFQTETAPNMEVNVDVQARGLNTDQYEVELSVAARAMQGEEALFVVETTYAGVFEIKNVPREQLEMVMVVECPRLLFPFLRQIVADATRNGNYPPLLMEPIDFLGIYAANAERAKQQGGAVEPTAQA